MAKAKNPVIPSVIHHRQNPLESVLYTCEIWSLTLWEEHGLRMFENWMLRRIFGQEGVRHWKLKEKLHNVHSSRNIIRIISSVFLLGVDSASRSFQSRILLVFFAVGMLLLKVNG
jgi:hypothetical protein